MPVSVTRVMLIYNSYICTISEAKANSQFKWPIRVGALKLVFVASPCDYRSAKVNYKAYIWTSEKNIHG